MKRATTNRNEKSDRNKDIYVDRESGLMVAELANKYDISIPRVHRICMQEENKVLKEENRKLKEEKESLIMKYDPFNDFND